MKYDFTTVLDRKGKDSIAADKIPVEGASVDPGFDEIPMWIADMNFPTAPAVQEAMIERIKHPAFGYFELSDDYMNSIMSWQERRNGVKGLTREMIGYENGVLGGVVSALNIMCSRGDTVLMHSPTYIGFTFSLENNGYHAELSPLVKDADGIWRMDYEDMERRIKEKNIHTAILCSPHNPCGRVWEKEELLKAYAIFEKYGVKVVSDEIWSDLTLNGYQHIPPQTVSEYAKNNTIAMYAPTKTFNLAGLVGSYHIVYDKFLRDRFLKESSLSHYNMANVLSMHALVGAFSPEGEAWLDELKTVLTENADFAYNYIKEHFEGVDLAKPQGTYMQFLDCTEWCEKHGKTLDELLKAGVRVGVIWQDGRPFHGPCHIRMNLALQTSRVKEAFERLDKYVFNAD